MASDGLNAPSASAYANAQRRLDPAKYVDLASFINGVNKPDNRELLVKTYGNQGITGFLQLTGAVKAAGTADSVQWWEEQRLHPRAKFTPTTAQTSNSAGAAVTIPVAAANVNPATSAATLMVREQDVLLIGDVRVLVTAVVKSSANTNAISSFTVKPLEATDAVPDLAASALEFPIIGNLFAQGSDQQSEYLESNVVKYTNPYMIVKEIYKVTGSQATNIGWINLGGGDYRWYVKSESDTRQRFMDKREMMMLLELDRQGASPEYALYVNRHQALKIDDMLAGGNVAGSALTSGVTSQYGAFNNSKDMAIELGFQSFSRGGYTFHKNDWKLLNDPTLLGASTAAAAQFIGAAVPMSTVVDAQSGDRNPSLELNYKATNGYSREMEHWLTGSILGASNSTEDSVQFNYRSECNLITRAANRHVLLKK